MSDEVKPGAQPEQKITEGQPESKPDTKQPDVPKTVTVLRRGRKVDLPYSKVVEMASKGFELSERAQQMEERERALRTNESSYEQFKQLQTALRANPKLATALDLATKDPDRFLSGGASSEDPFDDDDEGGARPKVTPAVQRELTELRQRLEELSGRERQRSAETSRDRLERRIDKSLGEHPWLQGRRRAQAEKLVLAELMSGGGGDVDEVVGMVAAEIREADNEEAQRRLNQDDERKQLRTSRPELAIPGLTPKERLGKEDLKNGNIASQAAEALRKIRAAMKAD